MPRTPVRVDTVGDARGIYAYQGPFESGGALYVVLLDTPIGDDRVAVFKSTDTGLTWVRQDAANEPLTPSSHGQSFRADVITIAYIPNGDTKVAFVDFDCATDTYGTPITGGPANGSRRSQPSCAFRMAGGETRILYRYWESSSYSRTYYVEHDGDSWGAGTLFSLSVPVDETGLTYNSFIDSSDRIHSVYQRRGANYILYYRRINADGTFSSELQIESLGSNPGYWIGSGSIFEDAVYFPCSRNDELCSIKLGAPDAEPPTLDSLSLVYNSDEAVENYSIVHDGELWFWWIIQWETDPVPADALLYARFDGSSWTDPVVFHDEYANPTWPDPGYQYLHDLCVTRLSNDTWGVLTGLEDAVLGCVAAYIGEEPSNLPWAYFGLPIAGGEAGSGIGIFV